MRTKTNTPKTIVKIFGILLAVLLISGVSSCASGNKYNEGARNWKKTGKSCNCPKLGMIYCDPVKADSRT
ncbi:MAG: hypothetical protein Q8928_17970 [Bacteroidota bacterium]|nr:hypothetical protein [Bacteroidota bacterium]